MSKCNESVSDCDIALEYGIDKSVLCKWKKQEKKICDAALHEHSKLLTKNRPSKKHEKIYRELFKKFYAARQKGLRVSFAWFYSNANKISREINDGNRITKSAITMFIKKYNIKLRRVQRK